MNLSNQVSYDHRSYKRNLSNLSAGQNNLFQEQEEDHVGQPYGQPEVMNLSVILADKIIAAPNHNFAHDIRHEKETLQKLKVPVRLKNWVQKEAWKRPNLRENKTWKSWEKSHFLYLA